jgi:NADPH:quinone reductase
MKAVRVNAFGDVDQLELIDLPQPEPRENQVVIRAHAVGVNYADVMQREGLYPGGPKPPFIPGVEAAGEVVASRANLPEGTRVVAITNLGCYAEYVCVDASRCLQLPEKMSFLEAAAFPVQYLTAYHALITLARASDGETVLIHAAAGGVGTAAVQIAKLIGLRVIGTTSTEEKRKRLLELGADEVLDYGDFDSVIAQLNGERPAIIIESVGGDVFRRSLAILPSFGRMVVIGAASRNAQPVDTLKLLFRSQSLLGFHLNAVLERPALLAESLRRLLSWLREGKLKIQVGKTFPLAEARHAHELIASRKSYGKVVLTIENKD